MHLFRHLYSKKNKVIADHLVLFLLTKKTINHLVIR